jgi:RHS repeat-associated protein
MEAGTTWYLNGEDSQGLSYEKEVKANGTTEHKHYVNAGGITFALYVKREGNLNGKPATSISYFHQDHLGSIAAITNEAGAEVERMAFDPWGKRRFPNGTADTLDAIWGVSTDRGYTMHEHLDEMGVIHMNGRVFDPLIGRFMSADPHIQAPGNLQSYTRYAYVWNNPLRYTDPRGYYVTSSDGSTVTSGDGRPVGGGSNSYTEASSGGGSLQSHMTLLQDMSVKLLSYPLSGILRIQWGYRLRKLAL